MTIRSKTKNDRHPQPVTPTASQGLGHGRINPTPNNIAEGKCDWAGPPIGAFERGLNLRALRKPQPNPGPLKFKPAYLDGRNAISYRDKDRLKMMQANLTLNSLATAILCTVAPLNAVLGQQTAQQEIPEQTQDSIAATLTPTPVPAAEIAQRATDESVSLQRISAAIVPSAEVGAIRSALPAFADSLSLLRSISDTSRLATYSTRELDDLSSEWRRYEDELAGWRGAIDNRSQVLDSIRTNLTEIQTIWEITLESAADQDLPEASVELIRSVLDSVSSASAELRLSRGSLLTLQTAESEQALVIQQALNDTDLFRGRIGRSIFSPDMLPLWQVLRRPPDSLSSVAGALRPQSQPMNQIGDYLNENRRALALHVAVFFALLISIAVLRRSRARIRADADDATESAFVMARPVSAALIMSAALSRLVYPNAPGALLDLVRLIWMLPVLRLLPGLASKVLVGPLAWLAFMTAVRYLQRLTLGPDIFDVRVGLLLLSLIALGGLLWFWAREAKADIRTKRWWPYTRFLLRMGATLFAVSIVANVLGYVSLAALLADAVLTSTLFGTGMFVAVRVCEGTAEVLMHYGPARRLRAVAVHDAKLLAATSRLLFTTGVLTWTGATLNELGLFRPIWQISRRLLERQLFLGSWEVTLGETALFALSIWLSFKISRVVRALLQEDVLPHLPLARGVPQSISSVAHYVILLIGFLFACGAAGIDLTKLTLLAGALGVGVGFGLQNTVNNFISGLILVFERPIQVGDTIEVEGLMGEVKQIGIRASIVRTFDASEVIVPNGDLISGRVINWTLSDKLRRIELPVGVVYGTNPAQVIDILAETASSITEVLDNPAPYAMFVGFGDSSLDFVVRFWITARGEWWLLRSQLAVEVWKALKAAEIEVPFPQRDLHLKSVDETLADALKRDAVSEG